MSFRSSASGRGSLVLGGSLTIENAVRIREEMLKAFRESDSVVLQLMEDVVTDISFMQLLVSAKKTAITEKKRFGVDWSAAPAAGQSMENAGYSCEDLSSLASGDQVRAVSGGANE